MSNSQTMDSAVYYYLVYGLTVQSDLELPELSPIPAGVCDITIRLGAVPEKLKNPKGDFGWVSYDERHCLVSQKNVARFLVVNGKEIIVDRRVDRSRQRGRGIPEADVRLFLLGSAMGALLHQRALLPLHVSAVQTPRGIWAFTGDSGDGKSTLAAILHSQFGCPLISDDVAVLAFDKGKATLRPGPRKLKLWEDAVRHLGLERGALARDLSNVPKFQLYLPTDQPSGNSKLSALVLLGRTAQDEDASLTELKGVRAFHVLMASVYRPYMASWFRSKAEVMNELLKLARSVKVYEFLRPWRLCSINESVKILDEEIGRTSLEIK